MKFLSLLVPLLFLAVFLFAAKKKVKIYDAFVKGAKGAIPLLISLFPYLFSVLVLCELLERSGVSDWTLKVLSPVFEAVGIPKEIGKLVLIKPFSGSGATALLDEVILTYGADSYLAKCACVCYGSSETCFYIGAVYFSGAKKKHLALATGISLVSSFLAMIFGCFLCKIL